MMLEFLGEKAGADIVTTAVRAVLAEGRALTPDLGGTARTAEVTKAVLAKMRAAAG
jgi:tartrate dehydrogenase/decarboxylase/D-malate dehydrogenase